VDLVFFQVVVEDLRRLIRRRSEKTAATNQPYKELRPRQLSPPGKSTRLNVLAAPDPPLKMLETQRCEPFQDDIVARVDLVGKSVDPPLDPAIVPAREDGFEDAFIGQNWWFAICIGGGMLEAQIHRRISHSGLSRWCRATIRVRRQRQSG
jgi:hypothetical protein